jgi:hypothetical protein
LVEPRDFSTTEPWLLRVGFEAPQNGQLGDETIAAPLLSAAAEKMVRRDASASMKVRTGEGGRRRKLFTKKPAAIPQQFAAYALPTKCI